MPAGPLLLSILVLDVSFLLSGIYSLGSITLRVKLGDTHEVRTILFPTHNTGYHGTTPHSLFLKAEPRPARVFGSSGSSLIE